MGVYQRWIVPRLVDLAMRNRLLDDYRQRTIESAQGLVLEIGVGSGLNLPLYGHAVECVCAGSISRPNCCVWRTSERRMRSFRCR
jgi:hypothetical protein